MTEYLSDGTQVPPNATRITFTAWTTAPYSEAERKQLLGEFVDFANEGDDDMVPESFSIRFEGQKEINAAAKKALIEALNNAETSVTLSFGPEQDDLVFVVGQDDE